MSNLTASMYGNEGLSGLRQGKVIEVARVGRKIVHTELITGNALIQNWESFADVRLYAVMILARTNKHEANRHFDAVLKTWDGNGIRDIATGDSYTVYKLALSVIAAKRLNRVADPKIQVFVDKLDSLQALDGSWCYSYRADGTQKTKGHTMSTALAILALGSAP